VFQGLLPESQGQVLVVPVLHVPDSLSFTTLEATQEQMDGIFSELPYKGHLEEVASVEY